MNTHFPRGQGAGDARRARAYPTGASKRARGAFLLSFATPLTWTDFRDWVCLLDTTKYPNDAKYYFEAEIRTNNASYPAYARLYNVSDNKPAGNATIVSTASTSIDRIRSGTFTPAQGAKEYKAQFAETSGGGATATIVSAMIWVETTYQGSGTGGTGAAPTDAGYLVTTAQEDLTNEVVVGVSPGGQLGGTWASPTVDASHSGSAHLLFDDATSDPLIDSDSASDGSEGSPSRKDHVHPKHHATSHTVPSHSDSPSGELGNTWASPTVDATHSGSAHVRPYTYSITFGWDPQSPQVFAP